MKKAILLSTSDFVSTFLDCYTDQGSVYASVAYNELIKDTVIVRSMSRAGKPTDNPVNESINGWMKEELYIDFKISECSRKDEFAEAP